MNVLNLGRSQRSANKLTLNRDDLTTHGLVVGRTGSGKTGLLHVLLEEAVSTGSSAIVFDSKGDLSNLLLPLGASARDLAPWVSSGKDPQDESLRRLQGLQESGISTEDVSRWAASAEFSIFTPGSSDASPVNLCPSLDFPGKVNLKDTAISVVGEILSLIGFQGDPLTDPAYAFLTQILLSSWEEQQDSSLAQWAQYLINPPEEFRTFNNLDISDFYPYRLRVKLARAITAFQHQASRWLEGATLDVNSLLLPSEHGLPKVTVFFIKHLEPPEQQLFISMTLLKIKRWMFNSNSSPRLRALIVLDEASNLIPPYPANPPTKGPISVLLAQGRAFGLGILLGTQNPNDLDYKAISNIGTLFLGSLRDRDLKRDLSYELDSRGVNTQELLNIPERSFFLIRKDGTSDVLNTRWAFSYLCGPLSLSQIKILQDSLCSSMEIDLNINSDFSEGSLYYSLDDGVSWSTGTIDTRDVQQVESSTKIKILWKYGLDTKYKGNVKLCMSIDGNRVDLPDVEL